jgi:RNA polymerase sigma-70 factor (ECF subfamily)
VNHISTASNSGQHFYKSSTENRSRLSGGQRRNSRPTLPAAVAFQSSGLADALHEMFLASRPKFLGMAYSILRNKEDAEDAVQDAFLSAFRHMRSFEGRSAFTTWFSRIVLNAALMILRKRTNSRIDSLPEHSNSDEIPWVERIPASQPDPETACAAGETSQLIDVLLGKMSPELKQAFTMTHYDELTSTEAGAVLGVSKGTFKSRLFRARRHLMHHAQRTFASPDRASRNSRLFRRKNDSQALTARSASVSTLKFALS